VIPVYNRQLSLDVIDILKDYKPTEEKRVETVEEPSDYIKKIYIIIGVEAMHVWTPRELTAIMLHELGHVFIHTANLPGIIIGIVKKIVAASIPTRIAAGAVLQYLGYLTGSLISISTFFSIGVLLFFVSHSLTFLEHRTEYKADQFAAKYGYGDEMIKALYKIHHIEVKKIEQTPWYKKILKALWEFFIYAPDHPPSSKRIERLSDDIEESYKQMYPKLSKELNIIISDIKSEA
jgi:Zn-dependent protease with chaperone function